MAVRSKAKPAEEPELMETEPDEVKGKVVTVDNSAEQLEAAPLIEASKPSGYQSVLASVFGQLDDAAREASARVADLKAQLAIAERDEQAVFALLQIKQGNIPSSFSPADHKPARKPSGGGARASGGGRPRGSANPVMQKILQVVTVDGLSAGDILDGVMASDEEKPKYRAALFALKKRGEIGYKEEGRLYFKV